MIPQDFDALCDVTQALYRAEVARMAQVLQEEKRLRAALARLDAQRAANEALPDADLGGLRQIGGDMIWQAWVGRKKAELQSELARVLARKGQMAGKLRRAFGKTEAIEELAATARAERHGEARARDASERAQLCVLDKWMSG